jgi:casein kinase II subunit alpha
VKIYNREKMPARVYREIIILQGLCGGPNIMKLYDIIVEKTENKPALVFEDASGTEFETFSGQVKDSELRFYMKELLRAIAFTHKQGVLHRDIKPNNVMFNTAKRRVWLIDFSLARFHSDGNGVYVNNVCINH